MKRENWEVVDPGIHYLDGKLENCIYCKSKIGEPHKVGCVVRERTVVVSATIQYVITVPEDWTKEQIEFHRNEGSWCSDNGLREIDNFRERTDHCLCGNMYYKYIREANAVDEIDNQKFVAEIIG